MRYTCADHILSMRLSACIGSELHCSTEAASGWLGRYSTSGLSFTSQTGTVALEDISDISGFCSTMQFTAHDSLWTLYLNPSRILICFSLVQTILVHYVRGLIIRSFLWYQLIKARIHAVSTGPHFMNDSQWLRWNHDKSMLSTDLHVILYLNQCHFMTSYNSLLAMLTHIKLHFRAFSRENTLSPILLNLEKVNSLMERSIFV